MYWGILLVNVTMNGIHTDPMGMGMSENATYTLQLTAIVSRANGDKPIDVGIRCCDKTWQTIKVPNAQTEKKQKKSEICCDLWEHYRKPISVAPLIKTTNYADFYHYFFRRFHPPICESEHPPKHVWRESATQAWAGI